MGLFDKLLSFGSNKLEGSGKPVKHKPMLIVYSNEDGHVYATRLGELLRDKGVFALTIADAMFSRGRWIELLRAAAPSSDVLILVGSPAALYSPWIQEFVEYFCKSGRQFLPIIFGELSGAGWESGSLREWPRVHDSIVALGEGPSPEKLSAILAVLTAFRRVHDEGRVIRLAKHEAVVNETRQLNEGKLILIGRGEVGKTSIVKRLIDGSFNGDEVKTQGIQINKWFVRSDKQVFRLNVWDFGGQEIMHATHQFFLTERSLYLLVLNGREGGEDQDAEYWLKLIEGFGGESPVIVVQNKIGQHPFDLNYRGMKARYPQIRSFVKTDCKDETGLADLRKQIESTLADMPEMRMEIGADWLRIKERVEAMDEEFLSYEKFIELCADEGIADESDRDALCFVLHCLGIALNYRSDLRLRETSILKPEWVTEGIYKILNASTLAQRQGELRLDDLQQILPRGRYPLDKHLFIVELMRKFSLCFPFEGGEARYLVPELLGKEEPEEVAHFQPAHCLNFEYGYGVLPEGLLPRFIVRTHQLSRTSARWRSGVVLAYEGCQALVKAEPAERRVVVRVQGGDARTRRNLLAIVRYDFERIHAEFKDRLEAQARVPLAGFPACAIDYQKLVAFERQGVKEFPEFVGQQVVAVQVSELLDGVDFIEQRHVTVETLNRAKSIFFSYSHKDEGLRDELETHLKLLQRQQVISTWHDRKILPGREWDHEIDVRLERAAIILLLVSADFVASDYCWDEEVARAMQRHEAREAVVIPVWLRSCDLKGAPFSKLNWLPTDHKAVTAWADRDAAWTNIAARIREVAENFPSLSGKVS
jgi:internalin A